MSDLPASLAYARQLALRPAWERQPENQPGYRPPRPLPRTMRPTEQRLYDPNAGVRAQAQRQQQFTQNALTDTAQRAAGGAEGFAARDQFAEAGQSAMEMTGAPAWARGIQDLQRGEPGDAAGEFLWGALNTAGLATLPFGGGGRGALRPPPRVNPPMDMADLGRAAPPRRPQMQGPNEDRYLFGRPPPQARNAPDAGNGGVGQDGYTHAPRTDGGVISRADGLGSMTYVRNTDGSWSVRNVEIDPSIRGSRQGVAIYEELLNRARAEGATAVLSDGVVSRDAQNVWSALERRGHPVEYNGGRTYTIRLGEPQSPDGGPVQAGPFAGFAEMSLGRARSLSRDIERMKRAGTATEVELPIRSLWTNQREVAADFAEAGARHGPDSLPVVVRSGGKDYLLDGNHRLTALAAQGQANARVRLYDLDARPGRTGPNGGSAREGFDTGRVVYRGLGRPYNAADGGYYQSFTSSLADAREYGSNVVAAHIRPGRNLAIDGGGNNFNSLSVQQLPADVRARLHPGVGDAATTDQIAHAAREAGYDSVTVRNVHDNRWGERPVRGAETRTIDFVFDTRNISPLDSVPSQPVAASSAERVKLSDADRALLAELEDLPDSTAPNAGPSPPPRPRPPRRPTQ